MKNFLKLVWQRLLSDTPAFMKKLQKLFGALTLSVAAALTFMASYGMSESKLFDILTYVGIAVAFAITVLQLSTADHDLSKQQ